MKQDYDNGKYTVIFNERTGAMHALRNGEPWQDLSGNKLVYWMLVEHKRALERISELEQDAARLKFICEYLPSDRVDLDDDFVACESAGDVVALIDTAMKKD